MADILFERVGRTGLITLNRPKALNALSEAMVNLMGEALDEWAQDDRVERVTIRGEGKAFCAGGDIRAIYEQRAGAVSFFAAEYRNNARVKAFPKPYVALIDGICMGGGVGVSVHGSHRVGSENLVFAMPEVGIGLFPDVGACHILSNMDGHTGLYLALTATRLRQDAATAAGIITHPTEASRLDDALDRAADARELDGALSDLVVGTEPPDPDEAEMVDRCFSAASVAEIMERLAKEPGERARACLSAMGEKSPTSLCVTFEEISRAAGLPFEDCIRTEFRILSRIVEGDDLYEGIRAVVIDKDNAPQWSPASVDAVDPEAVEAHFEEPSHGDLVLPSEGTM